MRAGPIRVFWVIVSSGRVHLPSAAGDRCRGGIDHDSAVGPTVMNTKTSWLARGLMLMGVIGGGRRLPGRFGAASRYEFGFLYLLNRL